MQKYNVLFNVNKTFLYIKRIYNRGRLFKTKTKQLKL